MYKLFNITYPLICLEKSFLDGTLNYKKQFYQFTLFSVKAAFDPQKTYTRGEM